MKKGIRKRVSKCPHCGTIKIRITETGMKCLKCGFENDVSKLPKFMQYG